MNKTTNKAARWGTQMAALLLALLLFSGSSLLAVGCNAYAASLEPGIASDTSTPADTTTPTIPPTATTPPTVTAAPTTPPTATAEVPTATSPPQPSPSATVSRPKVTPTATRAITVPAATATATAQATATANSTATVSSTAEASTPTATVLASTTSSAANSDDTGGGLSPVLLAGILGVLGVGGVGILLYVMMRRVSRGTRIADISGMRRSPMAPASAVAAVGSVAPVMYNVPQNVRQQQQQQQVQGFASPSPVSFVAPQLMENVVPYLPSYSGFAPLTSDTAAAQVMQMGEARAVGTSDMSPLALDFQQFIGNTPSGTAFPPVGPSVMESSGVAFPSPSPSIAQQVGYDTEEIEGDATTPVQALHLSQKRASGQAGNEASTPVEPVPALPWDLQPAISEAAQDDPVLGALKRQVQMGLFSIPDKDNEGEKLQG